MGFDIQTGISAVTVFLQGLLSFFSPCVLPLLPLYIGYLSGGARTVEADGTSRYKRGKVMLNTLFFVLGISFAFLLLGQMCIRDSHRPMIFLRYRNRYS